MGVERKTLEEGNRTDFPRPGSVVAIHYTGALHDPSQGEENHYMGAEFDSSRARGPLKIPIGVGRVIAGWDEGVLGMSLGEKAILTISSGYGYGAQGFPGLIPPHSQLVFAVHLLAIDNKTI